MPMNEPYNEPYKVNEPCNENVSDVVSAFSIAFVGLCRALEQQHKLMPEAVVQAIKFEMTDGPSSPVSPEINRMVMRIAKSVDGAAIEVRNMAKSSR
jgi:hypothetical protein